MLERATAQLVSTEPYRNITDLLVKRAQEAPDHLAFDVPDALNAKGAEERWLKVSTSDFLNDVKNTAKHLIYSGVKPGQTVAIMSANSYRWAVADLAIWFAGGIVVPIYETASQTLITEIVKDTEILFAFYGDKSFGQKLKTAIKAVHGTEGTLFDMQGPLPKSGAAEISDAELEIVRTLATRDDVATIVYTSGTTGEPKGVVLTHNNFLAQVLNVAAAYDTVVHSAGNTIIFLPLAHVLARGVQLICIANGMRIAHVADVKKVISAFNEIKPTFIAAAPLALEKIHQAVADKAQDKNLSWLWNRAEQTAISYGAQQEKCDFDQADRIAAKSKILRFLFDRIFYNRVREVLGGNIEYILSGGFPLEKDISLFFRGIKVPVIEGYGMTETTAPLTGNFPGRTKSGTVGRPLPGTTLRISDAGEVLAKGQGVFSGYRDENFNKEAFCDGYFRTGDLGSLDSDGYLTLRGRVSDAGVTSKDESIAP